jgi:chromosome segregation ATPase
MLTTIQELEKEIDQFHKNIKDSNELMRILMSVASLTKTQTESFEARTKALYEELSKLPPELSNLFQKKIESFIQEIHGEHQSYQSAVTNLMDRYSEKIATAESAIAKVPGILDAQNEAAHKKYLEDLGAVEEDLYLVDGEEEEEEFEEDEDDDFDENDDSYYEIVCPTCGEVVCFDESLLGEELMCPACGNQIMDCEVCDGECESCEG